MGSSSSTMVSVSSRDSRSSGLTRTNAGRPLRVTKIRSCCRSTRSANSDRCASTSENGIVSSIQKVWSRDRPRQASPDVFVVRADSFVHNRTGRGDRLAEMWRPSSDSAIPSRQKTLGGSAEYVPRLLGRKCGPPLPTPRLRADHSYDLCSMSMRATLSPFASNASTTHEDVSGRGTINHIPSTG